MRTAHVRVERRKYPVGILPIDPHVPIPMRRELVRVVRSGCGIIRHEIVRNAVERWRIDMTGRFPGVGERQVLHGDELE